jgi:hypothetical protein
VCGGNTFLTHTVLRIFFQLIVGKYDPAALDVIFVTYQFVTHLYLDMSADDDHTQLACIMINKNNSLTKFKRS